MAPEKCCVSTPENLKGGAYANKAVVTYSKEEFVVDFIMVSPAGRTVTSRVILHPGHMKRIGGQLHDAVVKYQEQFEKIPLAEEPK